MPLTVWSSIVDIKVSWKRLQGALRGKPDTTYFNSKAGTKLNRLLFSSEAVFFLLVIIKEVKINDYFLLVIFR